MGATQTAIYVRISQDRTGEGLGVERQETECRELAARLGWDVKGVYSDNSMSAYSGKPRPEYLRMLADLEAGRINGVIAWHTDRLHRSPLELEHFITIVEKHGVSVHTVQSGHYDLSTPAGQAVARTVGAWARYESANKGRRVRAAGDQRAAAGKWRGGPRPFGFEPDGITLRESEAVEILKAIEATVAGVSLRSIVRDLNGREVPTTTGAARWSGRTLRGILCNPRVAGFSVLRGEIVGEAEWPAIVPEETWRAAREILMDPTRRTNHGGAEIKWLGSGVYVCGPCGGRTLRVSTSGSKRKASYRCSSRDVAPDGGGHVTRSREDVDDYVERAVVARLEAINLGALLANAGGDGVDVAALRTESLALRHRQEQMAGMFADGSITAAQLAAGTKRIRARLVEVESELASAGERSPLSLVAGAPDVEALWFGTLPDRSDGLSLGARRAIVDALATVTILRSPSGRARRGVDFDPDYVHVEWKE